MNLGTGSAVGDALIGRYLNPRICNVDVKMFLMCNVCLLAHLALSAVTFIEAYQKEKLSAGLILLSLYTVVSSPVYTVFQVC